MVMEIGWTDVGSGGYILVSCAHSNTSFYFPSQCISYQLKVCQQIVTGRWFFPGIPVSSTNKIDHHDITELLFKVALSTALSTINPKTSYQLNLC
jgi:hypothetical protein